MKLEKWALIAEIVGSVAIVITLVILIVELRGNTDEMRAATLANIAARSQAIPLAASTSPELALLWLKLTEGGELSHTELAQAQQMFIVTLKLAEESFIAHRDGRLDDEVWQTRIDLVLLYLARQEMRDFWAVFRTRGLAVPGFLEYVDQAMTQRGLE